MSKYLKIRHSHTEGQIIEDWFKANNYQMEITGASNSPYANSSINRTMFITLFTEKAELATRLKWNVEE